jgi:crotonobetaine/carnitine-CoA ligase
MSSRTTLDVLGRGWNNVYELLSTAKDEAPDRVFLTQRDVALSFSDAAASAERLATVLQQHGVQKRDAVAVLMPNSPMHVLTLLAAAISGSVQVPLNPEYSASALARLITMAKPRVIVVDASFAELIDDALAEAQQVEATVLLAGKAQANETCPRGTWLEDLVAAADCAPEPVDVTCHDLLMLIMTSGTTGDAKAVSVSHGYAIHLASEVVFHYRYSADDVLYTPYPLFHGDAPLLTVMPALVTRCTAAIGAKFSASRFWDEIREYGATVFDFMGAVLAILDVQPPDERDLDNPVRLAWGAPAPANWREIEERFGIKIREVYGATECCLPVWEDLDTDRIDGACGRVCEHHEVRVVDELDAPLPPGKVGQILVRSISPYGQMSGYFGNPEATVTAWSGLWYRTGDLGFFDAEGHLYFAGRAKDVIRRRGRNIAADEIESVALRIDGVVDAAAIAVPSELTEDDIKLVVESTAVSMVDILDVFAREVPRYMRPRYLEITTDLPRTPTGKVDKNALRANWKTEGTVDTEVSPVLQGAGTRA